MSMHKTELAEFGREFGLRADKSLRLAVISCLIFGAMTQARAQAPLLDPVVVHAYRPNIEVFSPWGGGSYGFAGRYDTSVTDIYSDYYGDDEVETTKKASLDPDNCAGNPVIYSTGNKVEQEADFFSAQEEMPLHLVRTYNGYSKYPRRSPANITRPASLFGSQWTSSFDYSIDEHFPAYGARYLQARRPDGSLFRLYPRPSGRWDTSSRLGLLPYAIVNSDGSYVLYNEDMGAETYKADGYIAEIKNKNGVKWSFSYYSGSTKLKEVTHSSGRKVEFFWTGDFLTSVKDPAGNTYRYSYADTPQYGSNTVLSTATLPGDTPTTISYHYEHPSFDVLTGKSFNGVRYSKFTYDSNRFAISSEHSGAADKYTFTYTTEDNGLMTVVQINPLGKKTTYTFEDGKLRTTTGTPSTYCPLAAYSEIVYDENDYPSLKSDFNGNDTSYTYNDQGQLLQRVDAYGTSVKRTTDITWDTAANRPITVVVAGLSHTSYTYATDNRLASVTVKNLSANGVANQTRTTTHTYTKHPNGILETHTVDGPLAGSSDAVTTRYDALGNLLSISNSLGHKTTYSNHNGLGQPGRVTGVNGDITDYTHDARGRVVRVRQYPNGTAADTVYEYNGAGLLVAVTTPDGHVRRTEYDRAHRATMEFEQVADGYHTRTYEYNAMSLPTVIKTGTSQYRPDTQIAGVIDGVYQGDSGAYVSGWACSLYFDASVKVDLYIGGPAGSGASIARYTANLGSSSAVAQACRASGTTYRFSINIESLRAQHGGKKIYIHGLSPVGRGNPLIVNSGTFAVPATTPPPPPRDPPPPPPDCGIVDCHLPIISPDPGKDGSGSSSFAVQSTPVPYGTIETTAYLDYDELGRMRARRGNDGQNYRYTYDLNGNVETIRDSLSRVTAFEYDALDRLSKSIDAKQKTTVFTYDAGDRLKTIKDPRGLTTTYNHDGFGQLWSQTSPDTGTTTFAYNAGGQRASLTRNDGSALAYAYDDLGRVRTITVGGELRRYTYDSCANGKGQICNAEQVVNGTNITKVDLGYTPQGLLAARVDKANGFTDTTRFEYDGMGRLTKLTYPSAVNTTYGAVANYVYSHGKLASLTATIGGGTYNIATGIQHKPFGPMKGWIYGNGLARNYNYDLDGRMTGISATAGSTVRQSLTYAWNANDLIEAVTNGVDGAQSHRYEYDELSRLTKDFIGGSAVGMLDQFDAVGNRLSRGTTAANSPPTVQYAISPTSNQMLNQTGNANRNFVYTPNGHLQSSTGWLGNRSYVYDAFDRLKSTIVDGAATSYLVNALDQRVRKSGPLGTFRYAYAGQNTLLGEHDGGGATGWKNFLYLNGEPVALISSNGVRYFLHSDHLGRPEVMTDGNKAPVWKAVNGSYSRTVTLGSGIHIGFPGQYWDAETDTWYNGFRDYDPYTGRYIQSDPLGLAGGLNTYAYVGGNPVNSVDPLGLRGARSRPNNNNPQQLQLDFRRTDPGPQPYMSYSIYNRDYNNSLHARNWAEGQKRSIWSADSPLKKLIQPYLDLFSPDDKTKPCAVKICGPGINPDTPQSCPDPSMQLKSQMTGPDGPQFGCRCL